MVSSLITGRAYLQSARLAQIRGAFKEYERNREPMLKVLNKHRNHSRRMDCGQAFQPAMDPWWRQGTPRGTGCLNSREQTGVRNCQVTVLAPTGTVGFMMDCDTTGIEPEVALVKYKSLSGGGRLRMVNGTVALALDTLGYSRDTAKSIIEMMEESGTIEGVEGLLPEHLPVFDCAFRPLKGVRSISPEGHLRMMAAVQPFISGAISKTVNLPTETTVEQIEEMIRYAWKSDLKAVAFYRDGSKAVRTAGPGRHIAAVWRARPQAPVGGLQECPAQVRSGRSEGVHSHRVLRRRKGRGDIHRISKEGSTVPGLMDTIATLTSIALQYGVPLEALVNKFSHVRFEPSGFTSNPDVPIAKSLTDYIFRYLGHRFLSEEKQIAAGILVPDHPHPAGASTDKPAHRPARALSCVAQGYVLERAHLPPAIGRSRVSRVRGHHDA